MGLFIFWTLVFGACEIRTFLTTSRFADSHRVAIGLHATGFVSLCISLVKYFFNTLFCNCNCEPIIVYILLITIDTQSKINNAVIKANNRIFCSYLLSLNLRSNRRFRPWLNGS